MARKSAEAEAEHPRNIVAEVLAENATREKIEALLDRALDLKGLAWGYCPGCKKRIQVEVPDLKKQVDALTSLLDQAYGKPGTTDAEAGGVTLIVNRVWPAPETNGADARA